MNGTRKETKDMNKKLLKTTKAAVFILLACTLILGSLQTLKVTADVTITIKPTKGQVGTTIEINATIETENGFYIVRWNGTSNVTTGYAIGNTVQTSFVAPQTAGAPGGRNITVELIDNTTQNVGTATFELFTGYHIKAVTPPPPLQMQEGATTNIWVNITGGEPNTSYAANITVKDPANNTYTFSTELTTNTTGYGERNITYPTNFTAGAHTNYTGRYTVAFNETLVTSEFSVGLTNATKYAIFQTVNVRATNYTYLGERAWVNITHNGQLVFSEEVQAFNGLIETNWTIPANASTGTYTVTVTNSTTPGTSKPVNDTQRFIVKKPVFTVRIKAENLNGESLWGISVEAHNKTTQVQVRSTNASGVATFLLEMANYTFKAFWKGVEVGVLLNQNIVNDMELTLTCELTNIKILVIDKAGTPVPFISLTVNYSYTTELNASKQETLTFATNHTGIWELHNMLTNISYFIEARRYGYNFSQTYIETMPVSPWYNITITLPTYTATIHVIDSKNNAAQRVKVEAYEWSKGIGQPDQSYTTNSDGNVTFSLTFGKYKLRAYKDDVFLNEATIDLTRNQSSFIFHLATLNVDLNVIAIDYFGQPIPNAVVKVEQTTTVGSAVEDSTDINGRVTFSGILGGASRISIYIGRQLIETKDLYLTNSKQVTFHLNRYVVIAGYAMETSQFVTAIAIAILIVAFIVALTYKRLYKIFTKSK
jgi:hypothetical protein